MLQLNEKISSVILQHVNDRETLNNEIDGCEAYNTEIAQLLTLLESATVVTRMTLV